MIANRFQLTREQTGAKLLEHASELRVSIKRFSDGSIESKFTIRGTVTGDTKVQAAEVVRMLSGLAEEFGR